MSEQQFVLDILTITVPAIVTVIGLIVKGIVDYRQNQSIQHQVAHVSKAVNGVPGEPTVKEQAAIIQHTIRNEVLPQLQQTQQAVSVAAEKADAAAEKADIAATAAQQAQKEGC